LSSVPNVEEKDLEKGKKESVKLPQLEVSPELLEKASEAGIPSELLDIYLTLPDRVAALEQTLERVAPVLERINAAITEAEKARAAMGATGAPQTTVAAPPQRGGVGILELLSAFAPYIMGGGENPLEKLMYSFLSGTLKNQLAMQRHTMVLNVAGIRALSKLGLVKPKEISMAEAAMKIATEMEEE